MLTKILFCTLVLSFFASPIFGSEQIQHLIPVDEGKTDPSFVDFKEKLLAAIQSRDSSFIKKILADDVVYSFGADPERKDAAAGFMSSYKITSGKNVQFWKDLSQTIELGCTKSEKSFVCPYVYSQWPDALDTFSYIAVIRKNASIRANPNSTAAEIRSVNYEILKLLPEQKDMEWYAIDLGMKKVGYLPKFDGRSPGDYRVEFQKSSDGWKLKYFIAGD